MIFQITDARMKAERHLTMGARLVLSGIITEAGRTGNFGMVFDVRNLQIHPVFTCDVPTDAAFDELEASGILEVVEAKKFRLKEPGKFLVKIEDPHFNGRGPNGYGRNLVDSQSFYDMMTEDFWPVMRGEVDKNKRSPEA